MADHDVRGTDAPYGPDETKAILAQIKEGGVGTCPRCGGALVHGEAVKSTPSLYTVVMVRCPTCRRAVFAGEYLKRQL